MDISSARDTALPDLSSFTAAATTGLTSSAPAEAVPLSSDAISTSPLTFFGGVVEQIGKAMMNDGSYSGGSPAAGSANGAGFDQAIGLLEGVIGLMSAYGSDSGGIPTDVARLAASEPPSGTE